VALAPDTSLAIKPVNADTTAFRAGFSYISFAWSCAACAALFFLWLNRIGLDTPWLVGIVSLGIALATFNVPLVLPESLQLFGARRIWISVLISILMFLSPLGALLVGPAILYFIALAGFLSFSVAGYLEIRSLKADPYLLGFTLVGTALTAFYLSVRANLVHAPEFALTGNLTPGAYGQYAMTEMIRHFWAVSLGANGTTNDAYHFGSHAWLAALALVRDSGARYSYPLGLVTATFPVLMFSLCIGATAFLHSPVNVTSRRVASMAAIVVAGTIVSDENGWASYYVSPSHAFGLSIFLLALPLMAAFRQRITLPVFILSVVLIPVMMIMKVSEGFLWSVGLCYCILVSRASFGRKALLWGAIGLVTLLSLALFISLDRQTSTHSWTIVPFHFFVTYGSFASLSTLIPPLLLGLAYLTLFLLERADPSSETRTDLLRSTELLLFIVAVSALPGLLVPIDGGSAWYFLNVGQWIGIALLGSYYLAEIDALHSRFGKLTYLLPVILVASGAWIAARHVNDFQRRTGGHFRPVETPFSKDERREADSSPYVNLIRFVITEPHDSVVFVPPSANWFWRGPGHCLIKSFMIPGLTGHPMVYGWPPLAIRCDTSGADQSTPDKQSRELSDVALCAEVVRLHFLKVVVPDPNSATGPIRKLQCAPFDAPR
jgi:hypothetical protein